MLLTKNMAYVRILTLKNIFQEFRLAVLGGGLEFGLDFRLGQEPLATQGC